MEKVTIVIQARLSSSRLPNKVMMDLAGRPILERVIEQTQKVKHPAKIYVATSTNPEDDAIFLLCKRLNIDCYRGSLDDVRSRFLAIGEQENTDIMVRVTADNPLTSPDFIDQLIDEISRDSSIDFCAMDHDYIINGTSSGVFRFKRFLELSRKYDDIPYFLEHVTPVLKEYGNIKYCIPQNKSLLYTNYSLTIDTISDYTRVYYWFSKTSNVERLKKIIEHLKYI